jgi:hypothetical protein
MISHESFIIVCFTKTTSFFFQQHGACIFQIPRKKLPAALGIFRQISGGVHSFDTRIENMYGPD